MQQRPSDRRAASSSSPTRRDPAAATGDFTRGPVCLSRTCELNASVAKQAWCHPSPSPRLAVSARQLVERRIEYRVTQPGLLDTFFPVSLRDKTEYNDNRSLNSNAVYCSPLRHPPWKVETLSFCSYISVAHSERCQHVKTDQLVLRSIGNDS